MNCTSCDQPIRPGTKFCANCGSPVNENNQSPAEPQYNVAQQQSHQQSPNQQQQYQQQYPDQQQMYQQPPNQQQLYPQQYSQQQYNQYPQYPAGGQVIINQNIYKKSNGLAVAGFVFALIGLILGWIPILGWVLWSLGLLFSFIGIFRSPRGLAIAGLVITLIGLISLLFVFGALAAILTFI